MFIIANYRNLTIWCFTLSFVKLEQCLFVQYDNTECNILDPYSDYSASTFKYRSLYFLHAVTTKPVLIFFLTKIFSLDEEYLTQKNSPHSHQFVFMGEILCKERKSSKKKSWKRILLWPRQYDHSVTTV